ncbi:MAG: hypothetical protein AB7G37_21765, partial [Solirubrobacteraceae bacterium]
MTVRALPMRRRATATAAACALALSLAACGDDDEGTTTAAAPPATTTATAGGGDFAPIKTYLLDHTTRLVAATDELSTLADEYYAKADAAGFDYAKLLKDDREAVATFVKDAQKAWQEANPAYEEAEGVVAGVPSLAQYDVDLDAGSSGETPEDAVSFDITIPGGETLKKPGNFFFLTETSLWGTEKDFLAKDV